VFGNSYGCLLNVNSSISCKFLSFSNLFRRILGQIYLKYDRYKNDDDFLAVPGTRIQTLGVPLNGNISVTISVKGYMGSFPLLSLSSIFFTVKSQPVGTFKTGT
jgi:hypothetical protein